jgi:hypothetical protein
MRNFLRPSLGHLTHFEMSYSHLNPHYNFSPWCNSDPGATGTPSPVQYASYNRHLQSTRNVLWPCYIGDASHKPSNVLTSITSNNSLTIYYPFGGRLIRLWLRLRLKLSSKFLLKVILCTECKCTYMCTYYTYILNLHSIRNYRESL